jgi:hypothetical protein
VVPLERRGVVGGDAVHDVGFLAGPDRQRVGPLPQPDVADGRQSDEHVAGLQDVSEHRAAGGVERGGEFAEPVRPVEAVYRELRAAVGKTAPSSPVRSSNEESGRSPAKPAWSIAH